MKTFKRIASLIIAIAMMAAMVVMPVSAAEKVAKIWNFDDNTVPADVVGPFGAVADGIYSSRGKRAHTINFGGGSNPLGFTMAEYPYFEANWKYWLYSGEEDASRRQMYLNFYENIDGKDTLVGQLQFTTDTNGEKVSNTMAVHTYEFSKGVLTAKGTATTIDEMLTKKISKINWQPWNIVTSPDSFGAVHVDYFKIFGYDMDMAVSAPTAVYSGDTAQITATVTGNTPDKVDFYVDGELAGTATEAPYSLSYKFEGEKNITVTAVAATGDKTVEKSAMVSVIKSGRVDFDSYVPPHILRANATISADGEMVYTGNASAVNVGTTSYNFVKGGADLTKNKYLKMRLKLSGEAKTDPYMISFGVMGPGGTPSYGTLIANEDMNGNTFSTEYQQFVFDMTKITTTGGATIDFTDKPVGIIQLWPMRTVSTGTLSIDWIELSDDPTVEDENPTIVSIAADKTSVYSGTEVKLTASVEGTAPEKIEFYADGKLISTDETAPYTATYTVTGEKKYNFVAKGVNGDKVSESAGVAVISYNELRIDFNGVIPPTFYNGSAVLNGDGTVSITGAWNSGINIGMPNYPIKKGGFDPTEYRFIKMRAKLSGTANSDSYTVSYTLRPDGLTSGGVTKTHVKDENGKTFTEEYQELVFDITKAGNAGGTATENGLYGWMQMLPMRKVNPGTITIDYIELSKDPIVTLTTDKSGVYREGVEVTLTADVVGTEANSVKFYDGDILIGEDKTAPYSITYTAMGEAKHEFTAKAETASGTIKSLPGYVSTYTEMRFDFNTVIPPNFETGTATKTLDGEGAVKIEGANSTMINVGRPENPLKVGGFDPTDYKYMKIRAKLLGTPKNDQFALSFAMYDIDSTASYGTFTYKTDMYGNTFTEEYQELVFDLTDGRHPDTGEVIDISGKRAGWLQIMPMRKANPAVMYIDYIEFVSAKPYKIGTPELAGESILTSTVLNDNMDDVVDTDSIVYIAAKYKGNDLTDVKLTPVTLTENVEDTTPIDVSAMEIADGERIDVMAVKSFGDMTPIMEKATVYDNGISAKDAEFAGAFMDHMVLQRDMPVNVWGKADAADGSMLEISFAGNTVSATVENGKWEAKLPALQANAEGQTLCVKSLAGTKEITDVLVGDVYLIGGQSNAQFTLNGTDTWEADRENAVPEDNIRILFSMNGGNSNGYSEVKRDDPLDKAVWQIAEDKTEAEAGWDKYGHTMINFSAIGYYMADTLRADGIDVPLGLVSFAKSGGTLASIVPAHLSEGVTDSRKAQAYNALLAPVEKFTSKGMVWYQGESDSNDTLTKNYEERFSKFVDYMRDTTGNAAMPVFMVQLSSHSDQAEGTTATWQLGQFRSMQTDMILNGNIDGLYMVASLDKGWKTGDSDMAHPKYKKPIGERLAKVVENVLYNGENTTMPMPVSVDFGEGYCSITFDKELTEDYGVLGFELIKDGVAYAAKAEAYENMVDIAVEDDALCNSIADGVRYAFYNAASPLVASLKGANGLYVPTFAIDNPEVEVETAALYIDPISTGLAETAN